MNKLIAFVFSFLLLFAVTTPVFAQEEVLGNKEVVVEEVNSFELFWPLVAGKTKDDSLYFLKSAKENLRGILIFGKPQKAEYALFLATKRMIEVEKLLADGKKDLANETIDAALSQFEVASANIAASGGDLSSTVDEINNKLNNLEKFLPWLISKNKESEAKLQQVLEKVKEIHTKV